MELQAALKGQYKAGLAMLRECIERCPDAVWTAGQHPRTFWRIAYHALFYTHFYLMPTMEDLVPWEKHVPHARILWDDDEDGMPPTDVFYSREELLGYLDMAVTNVDGWVDALDLAAETSGFDWYQIPKLDHQLVNIRHLGVHVGQLQELLYAEGVELDWISRR
jgi:hypothetical protein